MSNITDGGCLVEWSAVKMSAAQTGEIHYKVQVTKGREAESKMVSEGTTYSMYVGIRFHIVFFISHCCFSKEKNHISPHFYVFNQNFSLLYC